MPHPICEMCDERPAVVFITQTVDNATKKGRFCETCARAKAAGEGWLAQLAQQWGDEGEAFSNAMRAALEDVPLDEILLELFEAEGADESDATPHSVAENAFSAAFEDDLFEDELFENDLFAKEMGAVSPLFGEASPREELEPRAISKRCPNCLTTWDTLKNDGRAGCPACYTAFRAQLGEVVARLQRGENHVGKMPRAAGKRERRGQNLQKRRENQLQLLQNRLREAVASEQYEEAAKLRDKIKAVSK